MKAIDTLTEKKAELAARLAAARVKTPEAVIAAELAAVSEQLTAAQAEEHRAELARKQAGIEALADELEAALVARLKHGAAEVETLTALLLKAQVTRNQAQSWPNDLSCWRFTHPMGSLSTLLEAYRGELIGADRRMPELAKKAGTLHKYR